MMQATPYLGVRLSPCALCAGEPMVPWFESTSSLVGDAYGNTVDNVVLVVAGNAVFGLIENDTN